MGKKKEPKICVNISNCTTLSWEEEHRAVYLTPEDFVRPHVEEVECGYKARQSYLETYFVFDRISKHHLVRSETYIIGRRGFVKKQRFRNLEVLCSVSDTEAMERCRQLAKECLKGG